MVTFLWATHGEYPAPGLTATAAEFPDLAAPSPLRLSVDAYGRYRATVVDPIDQTTSTGYVRRTWARDRLLAQLGVTVSRINLRRR